MRFAHKTGDDDMFLRACVSAFLPLFLCFSLASAQNFSGDARKIGMGGIGHSDNIASGMIEDERDYTSIVIPLGLFQLLQDTDRFNPDEDVFDPVFAFEGAANPLHYIIDRDPGGNRGRFVADLMDGELNRDLNVYRGFVPTNSLTAEGLLSPGWGKTIKVHKKPNGAFHGFYLGVGPYVSIRTVLDIDKGLTDVFSSPTPVQIPNRSFSITDVSAGQAALSIIGGYRGRIALAGRAPGTGNRNGIYLGANYRYLHGFRYETTDMKVRFDTGSNGLITLLPATAPAVVNYSSSKSGKGFALDFGVAAVVDHWEFGFGANGVGNRIDWETLSNKRFSLDSLVDGDDFEERLPYGPNLLRVELPVEYIGNAAFNAKSWSAAAEICNGFQGTSFHGGLEYRLGALELRGGGSYGMEKWHPSGGIGLNLGSVVSIDVAAFGTATNIERQLKTGIAVSIRINHGKAATPGS